MTSPAEISPVPRADWRWLTSAVALGGAGAAGGYGLFQACGPRVALVAAVIAGLLAILLLGIGQFDRRPHLSWAACTTTGMTLGVCIALLLDQPASIRTADSEPTVEAQPIPPPQDVTAAKHNNSYPLRLAELADISDGNLRDILSKPGITVEQAIGDLSKIEASESFVLRATLEAYLGHEEAVRRELRTLSTLGGQTSVTAASKLGALLSHQWTETHVENTLVLSRDCYWQAFLAAEGNSIESANVAAGLAAVTGQLVDLGSGSANLAETLSAVAATLPRIEAPPPPAPRKLLVAHASLLRRLASDGENTAQLQLAVSEFTQALDVSDGTIPPAEAAPLHNELGLTHRLLAEIDKHSSHLATAIANYRTAHALYVGIGNQSAAGTVAYNAVLAIAAADATQQADVSLNDHLALLDDAIRGLDQHRERLFWSQLQVRRGDVLLAAGEASRNVTLLRRAGDALALGLETAQTDGRSRVDWALAQNKLANALQLLGEAEYSGDILTKALKARLNAWVLYQYAGLDRYQFYFEDRISALEGQLAAMSVPLGQPIPVEDAAPGKNRVDEE